jgi:hypothetical protein
MLCTYRLMRLVLPAVAERPTPPKHNTRPTKKETRDKIEKTQMPRLKMRNKTAVRCTVRQTDLWDRKRASQPAAKWTLARAMLDLTDSLKRCDERTHRWPRRQPR